MLTSAASNNFCCNNTKFVLITIYRNCWSVEACISSKKYRENVNMEKMSFTVWGRASRLRHVAARRRVCARSCRAVRSPRRDHTASSFHSTERVLTRAPRDLAAARCHRRVLCPLMPRNTHLPPRPHNGFSLPDRARVNTRPPRLRRGTLPPPRVGVRLRRT